MNRRHLRVRIRLVAAVLAVAVVSVFAAGGRDSITSRDLKEWLTYIASDDLEGRALYTTGVGLAAAYLEDHIHTWGLNPAGDHGSYLQTVRVLGVKSARHSTVTVQVAGDSGFSNPTSTTTTATNYTFSSTQALSGTARQASRTGSVRSKPTEKASPRATTASRKSCVAPAESQRTRAPRPAAPSGS